MSRVKRRKRLKKGWPRDRKRRTKAGRRMEIGKIGIRRKVGGGEKRRQRAENLKVGGRGKEKKWRGKKGER